MSSPRKSNGNSSTTRPATIRYLTAHLHGLQPLDGPSGGQFQADYTVRDGRGWYGPIVGEDGAYVDIKIKEVDGILESPDTDGAYYALSAKRSICKIGPKGSASYRAATHMRPRLRPPGVVYMAAKLRGVYEIMDENSKKPTGRVQTEYRTCDGRLWNGPIQRIDSTAYAFIEIRIVDNKLPNARVQGSFRAIPELEYDMHETNPNRVVLIPIEDANSNCSKRRRR